MRAASGAAALDICRQLHGAQGHRRALPLRPAHARNDRRRLPAAGAHDLSRCQARPADRLRRHRSGDPRHQRGQDSLLPQQAVGPARREALPGAGRPARSLEAGLQAAVRGHPRGRHALVSGRPRRARLPLAQPHSLPVAESGAESRRRWRCSRKKASTTQSCRSCSLAMAPRWCSRPRPIWPASSAFPPRPSRSSTTSSSWARDRPVLPRASTAPPKACAR